MTKQNEETLSNFRRYIESYIQGFLVAHKRIFHLLGHRQQHASGIFREGLLKDFFRSFLPTDVSVDSGYIYAFDAMPASGQLDIIIWHSAKHTPVYRGQDFVIVPPEAVICVLSVKSHMNKRDLQRGLGNLLTVTPIELKFRQFEPLKDDQKPFPPIAKFLIAYSTKRPVGNIMRDVSDYYVSIFANDKHLSSQLVSAYKAINPFEPSERDTFLILRLLPKMIATVNINGPSFFIGYGPPEDLFAQQTYGPGLRRLPYLYNQVNIRTKSFEKLCFEVLRSVYRVIGTLDWPIVSAWIGINPATGESEGDLWEIDENSGISLIDPDVLVGGTDERNKTSN